MKSLADILNQMDSKNSGKYIAHEWQLYGYRLAMWLGDKDRVSMYMNLAKTEDRMLVQKAWDFVKESNARSRPKLFLWKLSSLRREREAREKAKSSADDTPAGDGVS